MVPEQARDEQRAIAALYHNYHGHINGHATYRLVREKYWWKNMSVTIPTDVCRHNILLKAICGGPAILSVLLLLHATAVCALQTI
eukprot:SAG11_NODE_1700_length_4412_cov_3.622803_2_plen_85_part_00